MKNQGDWSSQPTHVVIGAGTSGLCLVRRLLAHNHNVILLERSDFRFSETNSIDGTVDGDVPTNAVQPSWMHILLNIVPHCNIWSYIAYGSELSIGQQTRPQRGFSHRVVNYVQGFGATSDINAMIFSLGSKVVYNQLWPKQWSSIVIDRYMKDVLCYFKPTLIHTSGSMSKLLSGRKTKSNSSSINVNSPFNEFWCPHDHIVDMGATGEAGSYSAYFASIKTDRHHNDHRLRIADCIQPNHHSDSGPRGKLTIMNHIHVSRVVFNHNNEAVSVLIREMSEGPRDIMGGRHLRTVSPSNGGEIVLCAGVFESPRILISSGMKSACTPPNKNDSTLANHDEDAGRRLGSKEGNALPYLAAIGENFQDHVILPYILLGNWYQHWSIRHHPGSSYKGTDPRYPLNSVHGWIDLDDRGDPCDVTCTIPSAQLLFVDGRILGGLVDISLPRFENNFYYSSFRAALIVCLQIIGRLALFQWLSGFIFGVLVCVTQPHSRGSLTTADDTIDSDGPLSIDPNYFSDPRDKRILYNAHQTAREIVRKAQTDGQLFCIELLPGPLFSYAASFQWFDYYASMLASSYFHGCGTCAMPSSTASSSSSSSPPSSSSSSSAIDGTASSSVKTESTITTSDSSVVLTDFTVRGVKRLRVVDASVIPAIPSSPLQAICMVLAEGCADLIVGSTS